MKTLYNILFVLLVCIAFTGCAGTKVQNTSLDPNDECPDNEPCLNFTTEGTTPQSTTVQKFAGIIRKENNKVVSVEPLYNGQATDRVTNAIDNTFGLAGSLGSAAIERDGVVKAAGKMADATVKAAEIKAKGGPETLIQVSARASGGAGGAGGSTGPITLTAEQEQDQTSAIGIELNQQLNPQ